MFFIGLFSSFFPWLILGVVYSLSFGLYFVYSGDKGPAEAENPEKKVVLQPGNPGQEADENVFSYAAFISGKLDASGQANSISDEPGEDLPRYHRSGSDHKFSLTGDVARSGSLFAIVAWPVIPYTPGTSNDFGRLSDLSLFSRPPPLS